jgi:hypothetical protein
MPPDRLEKPIADVFCHRSGDVIALQEDGRILTPDTASDSDPSMPLSYGEATVGATVGDVTYLGGYHGMLTEVTEDEARDIGRGTRTGTPPYTALWINTAESQAVLSHTNGASWGHQDTWTDVSDTPIPPNSDRRLGPETIDVWGDENPKFAVTPEVMFEFVDGDNYWTTDLETDFGEADFVDLTDDGEGHAWLSTYDDIFRHEDGSWQAVTPEGGPDANFGKLHVAQDGSVYVTDGNSVRRLQRDGGSWRFDKRLDPPCRDPVDIHGNDSGDLYVAGANLCTARLRNGSWTTFESTADLKIPQGTVVSDHNVRRFVGQPGDRPPLLVTSAGILEPTDDGTLRTQFLGESVDAAFLPKHDAVWVLTTQGVLGKYF